MDFAYHMYSESPSEMGSLHVVRKASSEEYPVWTKEGDQGDKWQRAMVRVRVNHTDKVCMPAYLHKCA